MAAVTPCVVIIQPADRDRVAEVQSEHKLASILVHLNPLPRKALYVGRLDRIARPVARRPVIDSMWSTVQTTDLHVHTGRINTNIAKECETRRLRTRDSVLVPELILTGKGTTSARDALSLAPNIWFRCGSTWAADIARREVAHATWTRTYSLGDKIRVGLRAAVPAISSPSLALPVGVRLDTGGFELESGHTLFLHIERPNDSFRKTLGCGMRCSVAITRGGELVYSGTCRIGGVLSITQPDGTTKLVGVTSGHALLEEFFTMQLDTDTRSTTTSTSSRRRDRLRSVFASGPTRVEKNKYSHPLQNVSLLPADRKWVPVTSVYAASWLGRHWKIDGNGLFPLPGPNNKTTVSDADFALLEIQQPPNNEYEYGSELLVPRVFRWLYEGELQEDVPLHVVLAPDHVVTARLLSEIPCLYMRGKPFPARKIHLEAPLDLGVSGSWVVQNGGLVGIIALIYEDEPFAYIVTAEKLVKDIKQTLGENALVSLPLFAPTPPQLPYGPRPLDTPQSTPSAPPQAQETSHMYTIRNDDDQYRTDDLLEELTRALVPSALDKTKYFLSPRDLNSILNVRRVESYLRRLLPDTSFADDIAWYINIGEGIPSRALKLFAILILINKPKSIVDFFREGLTDSILPLSRSDSHKAEFRLVRKRDGKIFPVAPMERWKSGEIRQFDDYQWYLLAPHFSFDERQQTLFYNLHERAILPFTDYHEETVGGFSRVHKARIHPHYHEFDDYAGTSFFAIKELHSKEDRHFLKEITAHERLRSHPHICRMLATFEFQNAYYLVLPWADGGNLYDMWKANPVAPQMTSSLLKWFLGQCLGLLKGLAAIHGQEFVPSRGKTLSWGKTVEKPRAQTLDSGIENLPQININYPSDDEDERVRRRVDRDLLIGRHGDIKPDNILCFLPDRSDVLGTLGTLQISDFGLSTFHHAQTMSRSNGRMFSPTYRAPEFDIGSRLTRSIDVWSLGAVFLEFTTWLLLGHDGVEALVDARVAGDDGKIIREDKFFILDRGPETEKTGASYKVKPEIRKWFEKLCGLPTCPPALRNFLYLVADDMLQINPAQRQTSRELADKVHQLRTDIQPGGADPAQPRSTTFTRTKPQPKQPKPIPEQTEPFKILTTTELMQERRSKGEYTLQTLRRTEERVFAVRNRYNIRPLKRNPAAALDEEDMWGFRHELQNMTARQVADVQAGLIAKLQVVAQVQREMAERS